MNYLETIWVNTFNWLTTREKRFEGGLLLGHIASENGITDTPYFLPTEERTRHIAIQGKTGTGKTYFILHLAQSDILAGRGFVLFDLHGDLIPSILRFASAKMVDPKHFILIDPTSTEYAVGMNPLEAADEASRFRQIAEITRSLSERWNFTGARTEELLRNALYVLSANGLTLLEVALLLANDDYRAKLLKQISNADVKDYFELRFDPLSDAMKASMREAVLNKLTELTSDPHFRYVLGQRRSTVSFDAALASGSVILVNLHKGLLGTHALTFGALVYAKLKSAIFRRRSRALYTVYADELQNLASADTDFDVLFSEARKFAVSIVAANQFAAQLPSTLRSAVQAIGTRLFFTLSYDDAEQAAREVGGGKGMAGRLANLPARHFVVKQGHNRPCVVVTPEVLIPRIPADDLSAASNALHAYRREDIEREILARRPRPVQSKEVLDAWE